MTTPDDTFNELRKPDGEVLLQALSLFLNESDLDEVLLTVLRTLEGDTSSFYYSKKNSKSIKKIITDTGWSLKDYQYWLEWRE